MFQEAIQNITAVAVMIDDVPYAPIGVLMDELYPAVIASGVLLGLGLWIAEHFLDLIIDSGRLLISWLKSRKASKKLGSQSLSESENRTVVADSVVSNDHSIV